MDVFPDFEGLGGIGDLQEVVGAALMIALIVAVLMLIVSGIIWAIATATGNYQAAAKARAGTLVETLWVCWRLLTLETRMELCRKSRHQGSRRRVATRARRRPQRCGW